MGDLYRVSRVFTPGRRRAFEVPRAKSLSREHLFPFLSHGGPFRSRGEKSARGYPGVGDGRRSSCCRSRSCGLSFFFLEVFSSGPRSAAAGSTITFGSVPYARHDGLPGRGDGGSAAAPLHVRSDGCLGWGGGVASRWAGPWYVLRAGSGAGRAGHRTAFRASVRAGFGPGRFA